MTASTNPKATGIPDGTGAAVGVTSPPLGTTGFISPLFNGPLFGTPQALDAPAAAGRLYPILITKKMTITPVVQITSGHAGKMLVAVYDTGVDGMPGNLVKSFLELDTTTNGYITGGDSATLDPGNYWIYFNNNAGLTANSWGNNGMLSGLHGVPDTFAKTGVQYNGRLETVAAYAAPAPSTPPAYTASTSTINSPVFFKVS